MVVIGGGAAGMMCAITAARQGAHVVVLERNDKIGRKLYITGKGRCNVTNATIGQEFADNIVHNAAFMRSALSRFDSDDTRDFFEDSGVALKVERGNRVFPVSDKSADIIDALWRAAQSCGVRIRTGCRVTGIERTDDGYTLHTSLGDMVDQVVVIATGGASYTATGSTGDGYAFARALGHSIVPPVGALVGLRCQGTTAYSGLSLRNVSFGIVQDGHTVYSGFGELLYTHTGFSGPLALTASSYINRMDMTGLVAVVDTKPALDVDTLDKRLQRDIQSAPNKQIINVVDGYLPHALIADWLLRADVDAHKVANSITKAERLRMAQVLKHFEYPLLGLEDMDGAIVTAGGVNTKEINPKTMESKLCPNLYWVGELVDVDCLTGGYNLQVAFSMGYCAGLAAAQKEI